MIFSGCELSPGASVTINASAAHEWIADLEVANEFLKASAKLRGDGATLCLRRGTMETEMHASLSPRQKALVALGQQLGGPLKGISIITEDAA